MHCRDFTFSIVADGATGNSRKIEKSQLIKLTFKMSTVALKKAHFLVDPVQILARVCILHCSRRRDWCFKQGGENVLAATQCDYRCQGQKCV